MAMSRTLSLISCRLLIVWRVALRVRHLVPLQQPQHLEDVGRDDVRPLLDLLLARSWPRAASIRSFSKSPSKGHVEHPGHLAEEDPGVLEGHVDRRCRVLDLAQVEDLGAVAGPPRASCAAGGCARNARPPRQSDDQHGRGLAEVDRGGEDDGYAEGHHRREEPASDDRQHAGDAVDRALAAPGLVGERRAHGDHEGHVGRGEGQLQRGGEGDQRAGHHQVDAGADQVERGDVAVGVRRRPGARTVEPAGRPAAARRGARSACRCEASADTMRTIARESAVDSNRS